MRNLRNFFTIALVMMLVSLAFSTVEAQNGDEERFPNGKVIKGEFLRFYRSAPDPLFLFGYPISDEMDLNGKTVQFFDRARFELATNDKGPAVELAKLGWAMIDELNNSFTELPDSATCRLFPTYGYKVCYKFLQFYEKYNGAVYFGEPRSNAVILNDRIVQYFDYTRLEWRTNMRDSDLSIGITDVGWLNMRQKYGILPDHGSSIIRGNQGVPVNFQARAFVSQALVAPNSENTVFVVVQTLDLKPIQNAKVTITIPLPEGKKILPMQLSNANGIARISIPRLDVPSKQIVPIEVSVDNNGKIVSTSTWYRIWY